MINHPSMSSRGRRIAGVIAILLVVFLPKRVERGYPGGECRHSARKLVCTSYEVEPLGFYAIEMLASRDIGFAYSSGEDCH